MFRHITYIDIEYIHTSIAFLVQVTNKNSFKIGALIAHLHEPTSNLDFLYVKYTTSRNEMMLEILLKNHTVINMYHN